MQGFVYEGDTPYGHYIIADTIYGGRPARVLYSGQQQAAQSGVATDDNPDLLFDYNQRFRELIDGIKPHSILLIGGGGMALPLAIHQDYPDISFDIVEIDGGLVDLAKKYFEFQENNRLKVHVAHGREFLEKTDKTYDMIIVDAFVHTDVPRSLQTVEAAQTFAARLNKNGVFAMNFISAFYGRRSAALQRQLAALQMSFTNLQIYPASQSLSLWLPQNFVITASNTTQEFDNFIRYRRLRLPEPQTDIAIHDVAK